MKRAVVVGGTGFIGLHVVDALLAGGWTVRATRRPSSPTLLLRRRPVELVHADLDDEASLERAFDGADAVFLAGAYYPRYSLELAGAVERGTAQLRRACTVARKAGVARLIYSSSVAVLGPGASVATEADVGEPDPREGVYPTVKKTMERELDRARDAGLSATSLLLGGCIGPWDLRLGTGGFVAALLAGAPLRWTDGLVHLVAVSDAARAHVAAVGSDAPRYLVAGKSLRVAELVAMVVERHGAAHPGDPVSLASARELATRSEAAAAPRRRRVTLPRELVDIVALGRPISTQLAERDLDLRWTPLEAALDAFVAWLIRHRYVPRIPASRSDHNVV